MQLDLEKVELIMLRRCWSRADLTRNAGLANTTVYKLYDGTNNASGRTIGKIAKALEVDVLEIIKAKGE